MGEETRDSVDGLPNWERIAVFRESFLSLLHPECAAAFRRVGETVYDWAVEDQFAFGRSTGSWIVREGLQPPDGGASGEQSTE